MPVTPAHSDRDAAIAGLRAVHARLTALETARERLEHELASAQDEIARRMYRRHLARQQAPAALSYLDDQIAAAIDSRPDAPFSRELARIRPRASVPSRAHVVSMAR